MVIKNNKTKNIQTNKEWLLVDALGVRLGGLATFVATRLQGKTKVTYVPNVDSGDFVIVINSEKVDVHPSKLQKKRYFRHSGYPGGLSSITLDDLLKTNPKEVIRHAVWGMMPKTKLGRAMMKKLYIYKDANHKHTAQKPKLVKVQ